MVEKLTRAKLRKKLTDVQVEIAKVMTIHWTQNITDFPETQEGLEMARALGRMQLAQELKEHFGLIGRR